MHLLINLIEQLNTDNLFGGGGKSLDLINEPPKGCLKITPNRPEVFKRYNYRFR